MVGCSDSRPETIGGGTDPSVGVDNGGSGSSGSGGTAGAGGMGGTGGMSGGEIICETVDGASNRLTVTTTADIAFEPEVAFATWTPNACSPVRSLSVGFDTEGCGLGDGELLQFIVDEQDIGSVVVVGSPVTVANGSPVTIQLRANDGTALRRWGDCIGSSGTLTFSQLSTQEPGGPVSLNFNVSATDCGGTGAPPVTLIGNLSVSVPDECPSQ